MLGAHVHAASLHDQDGGQRLLTEEWQGQLPRWSVVWADAAYTGHFREWVGEKLGWRVEVPRHPNRQLWSYGLKEKPRGFRVLPRRWVVERTLAWLGHARRLTKDYERLPETAVAMIHAAMSRIMLRRLAERRLHASVLMRGVCYWRFTYPRSISYRIPSRRTRATSSSGREGTNS